MERTDSPCNTPQTQAIPNVMKSLAASPQAHKRELDSRWARKFHIVKIIAVPAQLDHRSVCRLETAGFYGELPSAIRLTDPIEIVPRQWFVPDRHPKR